MNIDPVAFSVGPFAVRWYGVLMALAVAFGTILAYREAQRKGINTDHLLNLIIIAVPLSWLGARIYYVIFQWDYYQYNLWEIPKIWHGGLAIHGGLITAVIIGYLYTRYYKINFWQIADITAPGFILGQAIGRWGNFFNQEAYGYETDLPWAMYIDGAYRHPTFLYESIWNFGVFFFLLWLRRRNWIKDGDIFISYVGLYSIGRLIVEAFRTDSLMLGPFRVAQIVSLVIIILSAYLIYYRHNKGSLKK